MATWISLVALLISILSFGHTWLLRREDRKLRIAQRATEVDALTAEALLISKQIVFKLEETRVFLLSDQDPRAVAAGRDESIASLMKLRDSAIEVRKDLEAIREGAAGARSRRDVVMLEELAGRAKEYRVSLNNHFQAAEQIYGALKGSYEWPTHKGRHPDPPST